MFEKKSADYIPRCRVVQLGDYPSLDTLAKNMIKEKQRFERLVLSKEQLLEMFAVSRYNSNDDLPLADLSFVPAR